MKPIYLKALRWIGLGLLVVAGLVVLNNVIPLSPDEYFYANAVHALTDSYQGLIPIDSINVEHTPLVVLVASVWALVVKSHSLEALRLVTNLFLILSIISLGFLFSILYRERWRALFALGLVSFFPIVIYYGAKFLLDVPALLFVTLTLLGLVKKKGAPFLSLTIVGILVTKEYYFFLVVPIVVLVTICDAWSSPGWNVRIAKIVKNLIIILLPSLIAITVMIDFNIGPYPRFLENSLVELFRDLFFRVNQQVVFVLADTAKVLNLESATHIDQVKTAAQNIVVGHQFLAPALVDSPITNQTISFWQLLGYVYRYNFTMQEVSPLVLPLFLLGSWGLFRRLLLNWKEGYQANRTHVIFGLFWAILVFFTFHQGGNLHGFRILVPFLAIFIYVMMEALDQLAHPSTQWARPVFAAFALVALASFFYESRITAVGSVLSSLNRSTVVFLVKDFVYVVIYLGLTGFILSGAFVKSERTRVAFLTIAVGLVVLKLIPFVVEKKLGLQTHRYESQLSHLAAVVGPEPYSIFSNINCYKVDYYLDNPMIPNYDIIPHFRKLTLQIPGHCTYYSETNLAFLVNQLNSGQGNDIKRVVLYVSKTATEPIPEVFTSTTGDVKSTINRSDTGWNWATLIYK